MQHDDRSKTMYGISRIDSERFNTHAWRVSLVRHGERHVKNFPDKKWQGKDLALNAAMKFRDQILQKHPPISRKQFCNVRRRNNKSGITGVYTYSKSYRLKDGSIQETWYWEANWPDAVGESVTKSFSVKRYGEDLAKEKAIQARLNGLQTVKGIFWAAERGEVSVVGIPESPS